MNGTALASELAHGELAAPRAKGGISGVRVPYAVRARVGRLLEVQVFDIALPEDVARLNEQLLAEAAKVSAPPILLADHRAAGPFPQEVGDAWSRAMRHFNATIERSAILLERDNETFNLQIARVVRCAGSPRRRCFFEPPELRAWLAEVATPAELSRLDALI